MRARQARALRLLEWPGAGRRVGDLPEGKTVSVEARRAPLFLQFHWRRHKNVRSTFLFCRRHTAARLPFDPEERPIGQGSRPAAAAGGLSGPRMFLTLPGARSILEIGAGFRRPVF